MDRQHAVRAGRTTLAALIVVAAAAVTIADPALAQGYPNKTVRFVVPFPPGGTSDILSRVIGQRLTERWGQQIVVENRTGASGAIGSEAVLRAAPDGYTLLLTDVGSVMLSQQLAAKPAFDIARDFSPITLVSYSPHLLCVHQSVPVKDVRELIALAKRRSQEFNYASSPAGAPYMAGLLFSHQAGIRWNFITGKGGTQSVMDVITGQVLALQDLKEKLQAQGADPLPMSSADTTKFLVNERDRWAKLIRETGYKLAGAQ